MFRTIPRHEEDGIGLPYPVVLIDSAEEELDASGAVVGLSVPDLEGLAVSVAVARGAGETRNQNIGAEGSNHAHDIGERDVVASPLFKCLLRSF